MKGNNTISKPVFRDKEVFNRIRLRKAWTKATDEVKLRFDRLRPDYGDSRDNSSEVRRGRLWEGLKICR